MLNQYYRCLGYLIIPTVILASAVACSRGNKKGAPSGEASQAPKLELVEKSHDFGSVTEGDKLTHVFKVKNSGVGTLIIDRVTTSCGCTAAVLKKKEIPPGSEGEIEVTFDTNRRGGDNRKTISIQSNDTTSPRTDLEIRAKVETLLSFEPAFVRMNPEFGQTQVTETWIAGKLKDQAKLKIVPGADNQDVSVELAQKDVPGAAPVPGLRFKVVGKKVGFGNGTVTVETGLEKPDKLQVGYHWTVAGNVQVVPAQLYFAAHSNGANERVLRVSSRKADFKLRDAKVTSGPFTAKISVPDAGVGYEVHVVLKKDVEATGAAATEIGKLELISNDALEPKKEIPIRLAPQFAPPGVRGGPGATGIPGARPPMAPPLPRPPLAPPQPPQP